MTHEVDRHQLTVGFGGSDDDLSPLAIGIDHRPAGHAPAQPNAQCLGRGLFGNQDIQHTHPIALSAGDQSRFFRCQNASQGGDVPVAGFHIHPESTAGLTGRGEHQGPAVSEGDRRRTPTIIEFGGHHKWCTRRRRLDTHRPRSHGTFVALNGPGADRVFQGHSAQ